MGEMCAIRNQIIYEIVSAGNQVWLLAAMHWHPRCQIGLLTFLTIVSYFYMSFWTKIASLRKIARSSTGEGNRGDGKPGGLVALTSASLHPPWKSLAHLTGGGTGLPLSLLSRRSLWTHDGHNSLDLSVGRAENQQDFWSASSLICGPPLVG